MEGLFSKNSFCSNGLWRAGISRTRTSARMIFPGGTRLCLHSESRPAGGVERDDAGAEGLAFRLVKTGGAEEGAHAFAAGELLDGFAEVFVGGFFSSEKGGEVWEDAVEIRAVEPAERRGRDGEIEDEDVAAGGEDAVHFGEGGGVGLHIPQAEGDGEGLEGGVGEREAEAIGGEERFETFALRDF